MQDYVGASPDHAQTPTGTYCRRPETDTYGPTYKLAFAFLAAKPSSFTALSGPKRGIEKQKKLSVTKLGQANSLSW